jgi:hypothetical protein
MFRKFFYYHPFADLTLCHFLKQRLSLPDLSLQRLFEDFDRQAITLHQLPKGAWSTPLSDVVMLLKVILCTKPQRLMEVGSFRGHTALYMAQHTPIEAKIVTIDCYPEHGEAYRDSPYATKIERRVGAVSTDILKHDPLNSYDVIFLDADHSYQAVQHDSELLLPLLAPHGYLLWHDYANWGYFDGKNGVPEYLNELAKTLPIAHILGSNLAIYSPAWSGDQKHRYTQALEPKIDFTQVDVWHSNDTNP